MWFYILLLLFASFCISWLSFELIRLEAVHGKLISGRLVLFLLDTTIFCLFIKFLHVFVIGVLFGYLSAAVIRANGRD